MGGRSCRSGGLVSRRRGHRIATRKLAVIPCLAIMITTAACGGQMPTEVGDCAVDSGEDRIEKVDCSSPEAQYRVLAIVDEYFFGATQCRDGLQSEHGEIGRRHQLLPRRGVSSWTGSGRSRPRAPAENGGSHRLRLDSCTRLRAVLTGRSDEDLLLPRSACEPPPAQKLRENLLQRRVRRAEMHSGKWGGQVRRGPGNRQDTSMNSP
jgi:hypothetical protein